MENRIQINGVWYIKEPPFEPVKLEVADYIGCVVEDEFFCFDAVVHPDHLKDVTIKVTDKRSKPWENEFWDSKGWMRGVLEGKPESLKILQSDGWGQGDIKYLQSFLHHLTEKGWL